MVKQKKKGWVNIINGMAEQIQMRWVNRKRWDG